MEVIFALETKARVAEDVIEDALFFNEEDILCLNNIALSFFLMQK
jgi:hypothetical protein